jgi:hypothetical protein
MAAGDVNTLWSLTDMVRVIEEWEPARSTKIGGLTLVGLASEPTQVQRPRLPTDKQRAERYLRQAQHFREMGMAEPIESIREQLLDVAEKYQQLAHRLLQID